MSHPRDFPVYKLLFAMVCMVVDRTDNVLIKTVWTDDGAIFTISVHPEDIGKLIGKQGRTAASIRTIVGESGMKLDRRFTVDIEGESAATLNC